MTLPIFISGNRDMVMMQTKWSAIIDPVLNFPVNNGIILQDVVLTTGDNTINHKLGRDLQGWFITRLRAAATIFDKQDANSFPQLTLVLNTSANVTVDMVVF